MYPALRAIVAIGSVLVFAVGLLLLVAGGPPAAGGLWALVIGGIGLLVVALERTRYRSLQADRAAESPGPGGGESPGESLEPRFQPTDEIFADPTSDRRMRVFLDPRTGERRYQAEG